MTKHTQIVFKKLNELKAYRNNARTHSKKQIQQIANSIERFGFTNPLLIRPSGEIVAGHGRLAAARLLGLDDVPTIELSHLSDADVRALVLADNKLALNAGWDSEILAIELQGLIDEGFDVEITGFSLAEIDLTLDLAAGAKSGGKDAADDQVPERKTDPVTRQGDIWILGRHRLICGDARDPDVFGRLMEEEKAHLIFADPPYNVPINGHVLGAGQHQHREFAFAGGEMSAGEFTQFLKCTLGNAADWCRDGSIAFVCMDWRHQLELLTAGRAVFDEMKNLCVWNKTNGGMGTFYRSKHELVFVFKKGQAPHTNTFGLGDSGRYRTNVWDYPGVNSFSSSRADDLAMHPTVKPVALVADAIKDCTRRGEVVLDPFGGSGTTLIAAQKVGRSARLIEFDPQYCDTIIQRFQAYTGHPATLAATGETFEQIEEARSDGEEIQ